MVIPGVCINNRGIVAKFLEPWYGIGTVASAFGLDYVWKEGQAPAVRPRFIRQTSACAGATLSPRKRGLLVARVTGHGMTASIRYVDERELNYDSG
ncbi:MAG: hypothetical protein MUO33_00145 [Sedimentisphaerales bacterium]|nr:hypothetical protein [Sedimentisphaerales bacterium]